MSVLLDPSLYDGYSFPDYDHGQLICDGIIGLQHVDGLQVEQHDIAMSYPYDTVDSLSMDFTPWSTHNAHTESQYYDLVDHPAVEISQVLIDPQLFAADHRSSGGYSGEIPRSNDHSESGMFGPLQSFQPFVGFTQQMDGTSFDDSVSRDPFAGSAYPPTSYDLNRYYDAGQLYAPKETPAMPRDTVPEPKYPISRDAPMRHAVVRNGIPASRHEKSRPFVYTPQSVNDLTPANTASRASFRIKPALNPHMSDVLPSSVSADGKRFKVGDLIDMYLHANPSERKSSAGLKLRKRNKKPCRQREYPEPTRFEAFTSDISHQDFMHALRYRMNQLDTLKTGRGTEYGDRVTTMRNEESENNPPRPALQREYISDPSMDDMRSREIRINKKDWKELYMTRPSVSQWSRARHVIGSPPPQVYTEEVDSLDGQAPTFSETNTTSLRSANQGPSAGTQSRLRRSAKATTAISRKDDHVDRMVAFRYASRRKEERPARRVDWRNIRGGILDSERYQELQEYASANSLKSGKQLDPYTTVQGLRASRNEPPL